MTLRSPGGIDIRPAGLVPFRLLFRTGGNGRRLELDTTTRWLLNLSSAMNLVNALPTPISAALKAEFEVNSNDLVRDANGIESAMADTAGTEARTRPLRARRTRK